MHEAAFPLARKKWREKRYSNHYENDAQKVKIKTQNIYFFHTTCSHSELTKHDE
jgi:hypothetical protein